MALLVTAGATACADDGPATRFCTDYGDTMHELVLAARDYEAESFSRTLDATRAKLADLRHDAPDQRLRDAFDTASFTLTVFSSDDLFADFLTRADFSDNAMVMACADYGVEIRPAEG